MLRYLFVRRTDWTVLVIACTVSLSLMLLEARLQARVAWFIQHTILAPFEVTVGWVDQSVGVYWENHQLRQRLTQLQIESDALQSERMENVRLRRLLSLEERHPYNLVAASVVARSLDRLGGSLTIDKGTADGVEPGRAVLTPDGLVGRAERSTPHETRVLTLLNRDCAVAARIERTRVDGILEWEYGTQPVLDLRYVSSQEDVRVGDRVVTSGLGGIFPSGIRIGTIVRVALDPNGLMKEIVVQPAVDFRSVEEILVYVPSDLRGTAPSDLFLEEPKPAAAPGDSAATDSAAAPSSAAAHAVAAGAGQTGADRAGAAAPPAVAR
jgi:rod shape-determining protein MreC